MKNKQKEISAYELLGVTITCSDEVIKTHWKTLARELHPDKNGGTAEANIAFAEVSRAYAILSDKKARAKYDAQLKLMSNPCPVCKGEGRTFKQKGFSERIAVVCIQCSGTGRT